MFSMQSVLLDESNLIVFGVNCVTMERGKDKIAKCGLFHTIFDGKKVLFLLHFG
jgi:hypothetical protein